MAQATEHIEARLERYAQELRGRGHEAAVEKRMRCVTVDGRWIPVEHLDSAGVDGVLDYMRRYPE